MTKSATAWSEAELDAAVLDLFAEFPNAPMAACARALEHCRHTVPPGAIAALSAAMRERLSLDPHSQRKIQVIAV